MAQQIQLRNDTAANWTSANPILAAGEFGIETDTLKYKLGDGSTAWASLSYASLPATAVTLAGIQTLTNKTLTAPTLTAPLLGRDDSSTEGGQIDFARATDNAIGWSIDAYGNTTTPALRFIQNGSSVAFSVNASRQIAGASLLSPNLIASTETTNIVGAAFATGTNNVDVLTASVWWYNSNATASGTLNIRGNSGTTLNSLLSTGQSITVAAIIQNGATAYYPSSFTVDGSAITPKWSGGTAPSAGNATANDVYTYTITKTANATFTVWAAQTKFSA